MKKTYKALYWVQLGVVVSSGNVFLGYLGKVSWLVLLPHILFFILSLILLHIIHKTITNIEATEAIEDFKLNELIGELFENISVWTQQKASKTAKSGKKS